MLGATAPSAGYYSYTTYRQLPGDEFAIPGTTVPDAEFMHTGGPLYMIFFIVRWICTALTVLSCTCAGMTGERLLRCWCFRGLSRTPFSSAAAAAPVGQASDIETGTAPEGQARTVSGAPQGDSPVVDARGMGDPSASGPTRRDPNDVSGTTVRVDVRMSRDDSQQVQSSTEREGHPYNKF